jgi:hypothetical protein
VFCFKELACSTRGKDDVGDLREGTLLFGYSL